MQKSFYVLGIETSCDETAAAVYHTNHGILSNVIFSQTELHKNFGGVVPELASREQLAKINPIVQQSLEKAKITLDEIDVVSVTNRPGLPGSLLVGLCFAKSIAWATQKKLVGINHLEGHAFSVLIEHHVTFPHLCLTASGGHTSLYLIKDFGDYEILGETQDDAAGEAFDKIAKLMNLPYPGGPVIEQLAKKVNFKDLYNYPRGKHKNLNFSFSGLKTAVLYDLVKKGAYTMKTKTFLKNDDEELKKYVASSLLVCISDIFEQKLALAHKLYPEIKAITFVGGVACNQYISNRLQTFASNNNISFFTPSRQYCTDNAAMIAFVGHYKAQQGKFCDFDLDIF
ncbi:MAG TPA: tRNA (adenosine(37)-N6)-threonylcarbamoyltransferase complex transferase subunit TsaD [Candidatus Dependentiae bacterium]|nr:tRNA (adenosine(37)-N6)-threonylcarbamoyltransferase complex transferase subunit TsaD [Candidatus Dependentiae bacterium]